MAHLGYYNILKNDGYQRLEDVIKTKKADFAFETGKAYLVAFSDFCLFCIKSNKPEDEEGFTVFSPEPLLYTHPANGTLYVRPLRKKVTVNISE